MIYSLLYTIAFILFFAILLFRPRYLGKYLSTFRQRCGFGLGGLNSENKPVIWLHAVSVGETLAIKSLVSRLKRDYPEHLVFISTTTITGQETARKQLDADGFFYAPYDWKWTVRRTADKISPAVVLIVETELWPNFIRALASRGIPLVVVNGRISDNSFKGYRLFRPLVKPLLQRFLAVLCQSEADARRYCELGAVQEDVFVTGNLKHSPEQFRVAPEDVRRLEDRLALEGSAPVFLAASIHKGEEAAVLQAWHAARQEYGSLRLIVVPRKPMDFDFFAQFYRDAGYDIRRFSEEEALDAEIVIIDAIGQLTALYHCAEVAFVGGSLVETGGHNLLEGCAAGVPVLFGPHMHNFRSITKEVLNAGAGHQVETAEELGERLRELLQNNRRRQQMGESGVRLVNEGADAIDRMLPHIDRAIAVTGTRQYVPWFMKAAAWMHKGIAGRIAGSPHQALEQGRKLPRPVISVGGLSFGGAGKTPLTAWLAGHLQNWGLRVTILTRGYKGTATPPKLAADASGTTATFAETGDEPVMLARALPGVMIVKDPDRFRGGTYALKQGAVDCFLLDDGFQHRRLQRNFNILSLNADSIVSPRYPSQLLREPLDYAAVADAILIQQSTPERTERARQLLEERFPDMPLHAAAFVLEGLTESASGKKLASEDYQGLSAVAFCGIASPGRFFQDLRNLGVGLEDTLAFQDHHHYTESDVRKVLTSLKKTGASAIITTAKDLVRWEPVFSKTEASPTAPVLVAEGGMRIENEEELLKRVKRVVSDD